MAFTMEQVNRKSTTKQTNIKSCLRYVHNDSRLTDNVRYAVWQYANYRFNKRNHSTFSPSKLSNMVDDLLSYVIKKNSEDISLQDVINNENRLLYEIKRAIFYGATQFLYYKDNAYINVDTTKLRDSLNEPKRLNDSDRLNKQDVINYFKDLMI